jgi:uncharacterized protein YdaT
MRTYVICNQCNSHFDVLAGFEESMPCPSCKANDWNHDVPEEEKADLRKKVKLKERKVEGEKPYRITYSGEELHRKTNKWHHIERIVDRKNDVYHEKITDIETGEVIRDEWEPLSKHIGHGDDKKR